MARRRVQLQRITDEKTRQVTFVKRKNVLLRKAMELSVLCDCDVAVIVFSASSKLYQYSSTDMDVLLERYSKACTEPHERRTNQDLLRQHHYSREDEPNQALDQAGLPAIKRMRETLPSERGAMPTVMLAPGGGGGVQASILPPPPALGALPNGPVAASVAPPAPAMQVAKPAGFMDHRNYPVSPQSEKAYDAITSEFDRLFALTSGGGGNGGAGASGRAGADGDRDKPSTSQPQQQQQQHAQQQHPGAANRGLQPGHLSLGSVGSLAHWAPLTGAGSGSGGGHRPHPSAEAVAAAAAAGGGYGSPGGAGKRFKALSIVVPENQAQPILQPAAGSGQQGQQAQQPQHQQEQQHLQQTAQHTQHGQHASGSAQQGGHGGGQQDGRMELQGDGFAASHGGGGSQGNLLSLPSPNLMGMFGPLTGDGLLHTSRGLGLDLPTPDSTFPLTAIGAGAGFDWPSPTPRVTQDGRGAAASSGGGQELGPSPGGFSSDDTDEGGELLVDGGLVVTGTALSKLPPEAVEEAIGPSPKGGYGGGTGLLDVGDIEDTTDDGGQGAVNIPLDL